MRSFFKWVLIMFVVVLVPIVVNFGVEHINFGVGNNETWIGFWGSYIGAIVTAFVFYFSLRNAVKKLKIEGHPYLLFSFIRDIKKGRDEDIKVVYHSNNSDEAENSIKNLVYGEIDMLYVEIVVPKPLRKLYLAIEYFNEADKEKCIEYFDLCTVVENSKFIIMPNCHNEFLKSLSSEVLNVSGYYVDYTENIIGFEQKFKKVNNHNAIGKYNEETSEKTIKCLKEKSNDDSVEDWVSIKPLMEMI